MGDDPRADVGAGAEVGRAVAVEVVVGAGSGTTERNDDGPPDGVGVGSYEGDGLGCIVVDTCWEVGELLGSCVGAPEGSDDGAPDGVGVGSPEGDRLGKALSYSTRDAEARFGSDGLVVAAASSRPDAPCIAFVDVVGVSCGKSEYCC